jgi:ABC-type cobalamin/Fe3+-siderophores transport system ATPase subunit
MTQLSIVIKSCNSLDQAEITLKRNTLNIKYEPNGLGKSTVARAIVS